MIFETNTLYIPLSYYFQTKSDEKTLFFERLSAKISQNAEKLRKIVAAAALFIALFDLK